jgi:hypothetical protein
MFDRPSNALAFSCILALCLAGLLKASWWTLAAGACVLMLVSLNNAWRAPRHGLQPARVVRDRVQLASSLLNAAMVSSAAFASGQIIASVWSV